MKKKTIEDFKRKASCTMFDTTDIYILLMIALKYFDEHNHREIMECQIMPGIFAKNKVTEDWIKQFGEFIDLSMDAMLEGVTE